MPHTAQHSPTNLDVIIGPVSVDEGARDEHRAAVPEVLEVVYGDLYSSDRALPVPAVTETETAITVVHPHGEWKANNGPVYVSRKIRKFRTDKFDT